MDDEIKDFLTYIGNSTDSLFLLKDGTEIVKIMKATGLTEEELLNL